MPSKGKLAGEVAKALGCTWKQASGLIEDAGKELEIDVNDEVHKEAIMEKAAELWEGRKPTPEQVEAKLRENERKREEDMVRRDKMNRAEQLKKDHDFRYCMLSCCTCGIFCMCDSFFGCWKKKSVEEFAEQLE